MRSWCSPRSTSMADGCANAMARYAATCSPSWNIPTFRPTTMPASANCGPLRPIARSPAGSGPTGALTCSPTSGPYSEPQRDAASVPIRLFSPFCAVDQYFMRVEQILIMGDRDVGGTMETLACLNSNVASAEDDVLCLERSLN